MVSIVIPNYNAFELLKKCIISIKEKTKEDIEIIIVDNASKDLDMDYINNLENVKFIYLDKNYGFSKAVNEGILNSNSEYIILLNNDTEIEFGFVEKLLEQIKSDEHIFSVSSKMIDYRNRKIIDDAGDEYSIVGWTKKVGNGKSIDKFVKPRKIFSSCAGAAIYRKRIFEEIGYFDESFFAYLEDVDICYRANINGYKNVFCPDAIVYHVGRATSGSKHNDFKVKLSARNNIYLVVKNMPILQLILNVPFLCIGFFVKYLFFLKKGLGKSYLLGIKEALLSIKKIQKPKFKFKNIINYLIIELRLIANLFLYFI